VFLYALFNSGNVQPFFPYAAFTGCLSNGSTLSCLSGTNCICISDTVFRGLEKALWSSHNWYTTSFHATSSRYVGV